MGESRCVGMSHARMILPGRTYLITRRCSERRFLMRPDEETSNAYVYCLAVSAARYQIDVVAFGMMSNHHHVVVVDRRGRLPEFLQYFHRLFAAHQNVLRGRRESFWAASEQTSVVELLDEGAILDKVVYAICNPVLSGLVDRVGHWPGPDALTAILRGKTLRANRPTRFFREDGKMPERVDLTFARPPGFEHLGQEDFAAMLSQLVEEREVTARAERIAQGRHVIGRKGVFAQHWNGRPRTYEPRRNLNPRVAARSEEARVEALVRHRAWLEVYSDRRVRWLAGEDVVFPAGVWWLWRQAGVACVHYDG